MLHEQSSSTTRTPALAGVFAASFICGWMFVSLQPTGKTPGPLTAGELARHARLQELQARLSTRTCGSPAAGPDPYAKLNEMCIKFSPTAIYYKQHFDSARGYPSDWVMHVEPLATYDGLAVQWGIGAHVGSAQECADACWNFRPKDESGMMAGLPCNAWAYCTNATCFDVDIHKHGLGDCWLKWTEAPASPEINMRKTFDAAYRKRHSNAPDTVPWVSGVILPPGVVLTEGTPSPRWAW